MRHAVLILFLILIGCARPDVYPKEMEVTGYNFTKYTEQGFLITPESYSGDYESIGLLTVTVWPRLEQLPTRDTVAQPGPGDPAEEWFVTAPVSPKEVVDSLHTRARSMGADAIMNFRTKVVRQDLEHAPTRTGVEALGFAIRRKSSP